MNDYIASMVKEDMYDTDESLDNDSRIELDSHANMVVVGRSSVIWNDTGRTASANPFTPVYEALNVKIVDASIKYTCPMQIIYILVMKNALYVPSMKIISFLPLFCMRQV